ncbi:MAG: hypothetical protein FJX68_14840 [Alphaproteobacteria bacterium]|nr:hypothetical protein [Alphaproteobacteria bacterium]
MRIIFSRKGFDSQYGRVPSPILENGPISLPIPTQRQSSTTYAELGLGELVTDLTRGRILPEHLCHNDPDLLLGALGQVGIAQGHLSRQGVTVGDVFLFFGLFRPVDRVNGHYRYRASAVPEHRLFGWLQVGQIIHLGVDGAPVAQRMPYLARHPHLCPGWNANNTLYVASDRLQLNGNSIGLPGFGMLRFAKSALRLSVKGSTRTSLWRVPAWLTPKAGGVGLSYHGDLDRWGEETLQAVAKGQEFVADIGERADAQRWLEEIITAAT